MAESKGRLQSGCRSSDNPHEDFLEGWFPSRKSLPVSVAVHKYVSDSVMHTEWMVSGR